jgi:type VI secretion system protein ImpJ
VSQSKPIFWHHGMFLQPQHFQQSEQYVNEKINVLKKHVSPWMWGFTQLDIATEALQSKKIEIQHAEFLMEDGTYINLGDNAFVSPRSIEGAEIDPESPNTIYFALKKHSGFSSNATKISNISEAADVSTRYFTFIDPTEINDLYTHGESAQVQQLTLKLDIVLESEKDKYSEYNLIPFAQIALDGERLTYVSDYIQPCLNIQGSQKLIKQITELKDELAGRAIQLKTGLAMLGSNLDINALRYRMSLQALSRYVPRLAHEVSTAQIQPWAIYGGLRELTGEISTFTNDVNLLGETNQGEKLLPNYTHLNTGQCFSNIRGLINRLLNEISVGPQFLVEMTREDQAFKADIPKDFFAEKADFYLILNSAEEWDVFSQSLFTTAKLASKNTIDVLIERSLPGIGLIHSPTAPAGLPKKDQASYVRIDIHDDEWQSIERYQSLVMHWDDAPADLNVELVILKR